jgi:transcriptional regulator with XRE-family HTH domain
MSDARHRGAVNAPRFGLAIRALRVRHGWRQADLGAAAAVSRSLVSRVERGRLRGVPVDALDRVAAALDARLDLLVRWQGEGLDRLLDEGHARLVEVVVRVLAALGWEVAVEVSFARYGERGSIDVLAWHPGRRRVVVIEVKSVMPDLQGTLAGLDRKGRLGRGIARERGWAAAEVARVLVIWDTTTSRRRLGEHAATVRAALPATTREVRAWLRDPVAPAVAGVWFVPDVHGVSAMGVRRRRVRVRRTSPRTADPA